MNGPIIPDSIRNWTSDVEMEELAYAYFWAPVAILSVRNISDSKKLHNIPRGLAGAHLVS